MQVTTDLNKVIDKMSQRMGTMFAQLSALEVVVEEQTETISTLSAEVEKLSADTFGEGE